MVRNHPFSDTLFLAAGVRAASAIFALAFSLENMHSLIGFRESIARPVTCIIQMLELLMPPDATLCKVLARRYFR